MFHGCRGHYRAEEDHPGVAPTGAQQMLLAPDQPCYQGGHTHYCTYQGEQDRALTDRRVHDLAAAGLGVAGVVFAAGSCDFSRLG